MAKAKNSVPDRWYDYKSLGKVIEGTRMVAFKVPLQYAQIDDEIDEERRLSVDKLVKKLPELGVVIDLTNTTRYYDPSELQKNGVMHKKIFVPGHVIPTRELRKSFRSYVKSFLEENKDNGKIIGVHCTHGVNRTGFMICDYLVHELKMHPLEAIERFETARNHKIERNNYRSFIIDGGREEVIENWRSEGHSHSRERNWRKDNLNQNHEVYMRSTNYRQPQRPLNDRHSSDRRDWRRNERRDNYYDCYEYRSRDRGRRQDDRIMDNYSKRESESMRHRLRRRQRDDSDSSPEGRMAPRIPGTPPDRGDSNSMKWSRYSSNRQEVRKFREQHYGPRRDYHHRRQTHN